MPTPLILIIEDDSHIAGLVSEVLREAGYRTQLLSSVTDARVRGAAGLSPDAVISDLVVDGGGPPAELATLIQSIFPNVPLTLMTGVPRNRRVQMGVTHKSILEKPFELGDLLGAVAAMVGGPAA